MSESAEGGPGRLVLVGTPIGNLGDLSPRAVATLSRADVICCEDTRRTRRLLSAAGIPAPRLVVMHQHNEAAAVGYAVELAIGGACVAVVTDAGMPGVSDPGERVVKAAVESGVPVDVVPGPSASLTALVASGLPTGRFSFEGFLPRRGQARRQRLEAVAGLDCTAVLYEAPHRVARTLADLATVCGPARPVALGRELTKLHEQWWRGTLGDAVEWVGVDEPRGEWVVVLGAESGPPPERSDAEIIAVLQRHLDGGADRRQAVTDAVNRLHVPKRRAYQLALSLTGRAHPAGPDPNRT